MNSGHDRTQGFQFFPWDSVSASRLCFLQAGFFSGRRTGSVTKAGPMPIAQCDEMASAPSEGLEGGLALRRVEASEKASLKRRQLWWQ